MIPTTTPTTPPLPDRAVTGTAPVTTRRPDDLADRLAPGRVHGDRGQSTAEYALVLLGAAAVALAFLAWAGGTGRIADLFNAVIDSVIGSV